MLLTNVYGENAPEDQLGGSDFLLKVGATSGGALDTKGTLDINDFTFYVTTDSTDPDGFPFTWVDPSNPGTDFGTRYFEPASSPESIVGQLVVGFEYHGTALLDTYIVKAGSNYTVWDYQSGFNIAYFDPDEIAGGYPWDESATPITGKDGAHGISHMNFYGATTPVPEPGSLALFGIGAIGLGFVARRRFT